MTGVSKSSEIWKARCANSRLGAISWLEHRDAREGGVIARVLLVLRGEHRRVVCGQDDEPGVDARVTGAQQRVRRDIDADVLHRHEATRTTHRASERDLEGDLLVGRPFTGKLLIFGGVFRDFRTGGSRIAGNKTDACFIQASGNSLVAQH